MVESFVGHDTAKGEARAGFRIERSDVQPLDAGEHDGARAHAAGFQRDVHAAAGQPPAAQVFRRLPDGVHLGMAGGVLVRFRRIVTPADDAAVLHDDGADGRFS